MNLKLKVKFYFFTKNYQALKKLLAEQEEAAKYLNEKEEEELLEYATKNGEFILFSILLNEMTKDLDASNKADHYIKKYLKAFYHNLVFLYTIASILSKNPFRYSDEIEKIKKYILSQPLNEITVYIHTLNGFYNEGMEDQILKYGNPHFIFCLLENTDPEETKRILIKYLKNKPSPEKIYRLASSLDKQENNLWELKRVVLDLEIPLSLKGKYLLAIFDGTSIKDLNLIEEIIKLNDFNTTKRLMKKIEEDAPRMIRKFLEVESNEIIVTLACTTNCEETKLLINKILEKKDFNAIIKLIMYVEDLFLPMIFEEILKSEKEALKVINTLYLFGSMRWINFINYIIQTDKTFISKEERTKLESFAKNQEEEYTRKRNLTL